MIDDRLTSDPGSLFQRLQARYGLGQDPLAMDQPFFPGAQRQHALETLRHLAGFGDMALLVSGARGAGKTRLLAELVRGEAERLDFQRLEAADFHSEQALCDRLLRIAHHGLGAGRSPREAIFGFFRWSETATSRGRRIVLLVDDADHVPTALLQLLLTAYCRGDRSQGALPVLAGADSLVADLVETSGLDNHIHQLHLKPLARDDLADYLRPRLQQAGGETSELLSGARLKKLHELSQGSFGRLKRTAPAVWLDMAGHQPVATGSSKSMTLKSIMIPLALVVLLGVSWLVVSWQYDATVASREVAPESPPERKTVRLGPDSEDWVDASGDSSMVEVPSADVDGVEPAADPQAPAASTDPSGGEGAMPVESDGDGALASASPIEEAPEAVPAQGPDEEAGNADTSTPAALPAESGQTLSEEASSAAKGTSPDRSTAESGSVVETAESSLSPVAEPQPEPAFQPVLPQRFEDLATLKAQPGVTVQFIAGFEEETAVDFLNEHPDVTELLYTRSTRQGKPWYVVIYGQFPDRAEARAAVARLPGNLARHDVWIRSLSGL